MIEIKIKNFLIKNESFSIDVNNLVIIMEFKNIKTGFSYFAINKKTSFIVQVQITPVKHYTANKKFFILLKLFS